MVLTLLKLPLAIVLLGAVGGVAFGFPLLVALLFAAIILPTDPAAVLSIFEELDVAERLAVTIEGESLLNDGVAVVIFTTLLAAFESSSAAASLATLAGLAGMAVDVAVVGGGGLALGSAVGYLAHAETHHKMSTSEYHVQEVWITAGFLVTTVLYVLIGAEVRVSAFLQHFDLVVAAAVLVVLVRAATIYPLVTATNLVGGRPVPTYCQHVMVWGGLHTVVPVALVLSLPGTFSFREELQVMVFGVAVLSLVVQGLLMRAVLSRLGMGEAG